MNCLAGMLLAILAVVSLPLPGLAYDFQTCIECHDELLTVDNVRRYLHIPFRQHQCENCHAVQGEPLQLEAAKPKTPQAALLDRQKINWLADSNEVNTTHGFLLPGDKTGNTLVIELHGTDGHLARHEIAVPTLAYLPEIIDSGKPPVISQVQVLDMQRGVFLKVTIGWQTDTLTNGRVHYGIQNQTQSSEPGIRYGQQHQVVLNNLQPDRTYSFSVAYSDLFGRSQVSEPMTFSTAKSLITTPAVINNPASTDGETVITSSFQRLGSDYLLELRLEQPASIYLGSMEKSLLQNVPPETAGPMGGDNEFHDGLSSRIMVSLQACRSCHQPLYTATHPVNVYPKPGMIIPPEYPTLEDGRITCSSCHISHSSDYEHLARKRSKRELCVACHKDML